MPSTVIGEKASVRPGAPTRKGNEEVEQIRAGEDSKKGQLSPVSTALVGTLERQS